MQPRPVSVLRTAAAPLAFLLTVAIAGVDFGGYWDDDAMFSKVRHALSSPPTLLPNAYDYPAVTFWLSLAAIAPEAAADRQLRYRVPDTSALVAFTGTDQYRMRTRALFAAVSSLSVIWIAAVSLALGAYEWEALLASSLFAVSWEVTYHIRWIAPDGVMTQFVVASVLCSVMALRLTPKRGMSLRLGAVAAGLATATKYSAWPIVLVVVAASWIANESESLPRRAIASMNLAATAVAVFLVVSPGTLLQPTLAASAILWQVAHYATGHYGYTVHSGLDHATRLLIYCGSVLLSRDAAVAVGLTVCAFAGAIALARENHRTGLVFLSFPVLYASYFSLQRVMIVRNVIVIAPFLAVLAARGVRAAWDAAAVAGQRRPSRIAIAALATVVVFLNGAHAVAAVASIRGRSDATTLREFTEWARGQDEGSIELSARLQSLLGGASGTPTAGARFAMYADEPGHEAFRPNERALFQQVFGPREVNLNYYPDWIGGRHIVVLTRAQAMRFGVIQQRPIGEQ